VAFSLESDRPSRKQSTYEVHFGTATPDAGTWLAAGVDAAIRSDDSVQLGMDRHDFDRDPQLRGHYRTRD
jgi:hypothetical protein